MSVDLAFLPSALVGVLILVVSWLMKRAIGNVDAKLDIVVEKTGKHEVDIAVLQERVDRIEQHGCYHGGGKTHRKAD